MINKPDIATPPQTVDAERERIARIIKQHISLNESLDLTVDCKGAADAILATPTPSDATTDVPSPPFNSVGPIFTTMPALIPDINSASGYRVQNVNVDTTQFATPPQTVDAERERLSAALSHLTLEIYRPREDAENYAVTIVGHSRAIDAILATSTPPDAVIENSYRNAVDTEMVLAHIGFLTGDAKKDLHDVICWNVDVALDPRVSERARALQATPSDAVTDVAHFNISSLHDSRNPNHGRIGGLYATLPQAVDAERERIARTIFVEGFGGNARVWDDVCENENPPEGVRICWDAARALATRSSQSPAAVEAWQPISTAPKDGTEVLLWAESWEMTWGVQIGHFDAFKWVVSEGAVSENDEDFDPEAEIDENDFDDETNLGPTHWMPLPAPPIPRNDREGS
jgi:hypothetical protein